MPKKSTAARSAAQRNKPRVQKSFELVRPTSSEEQEIVANTSTERASASVVTTPVEAATTTTPVATVEIPNAQKEQENKESTVSATSVSTSTASTNMTSKGSAAARLAARRQTVQKTPQRSSAALITPEHYAYVRRDLTFIAILALIMFSAIIILHFVPGIGS